MPVFFKLYRCFCHGLKMGMWFEYYPQINFCHFFRILNLVIFRREYSQCVYIGYLVCATPLAVLCQSFWNFTGVFVMVWRCACTLFIILRLMFVTFFRILNLVILQSWILWIVGTLCAQLLLQFYAELFKLYRCFCHGLKMCMWFGYNPHISLFLYW